MKAATPIAPSRLNVWLIAVVRVGVALMWIDNVSWKVPPNFGEGTSRGLYRWTLYGVEYEVLAPWAWFVETVVVPNFLLFGWLVLAMEASLGAFLLIGLFTRAFALLGVVQSLAITFSVLNAPHEWYWAYLLMILIHLLLFAVAAGRYGGMDGILRPLWIHRNGRVYRLMKAAS
ncbi:TQO small subunit DoxD [Glycomyces buryatensis]|uniref:DoxX family membrane protein n=1 Tax=Glycomyces buryatensis TaxID=2570927 RepID=A0A4S8PPE0_9ACTN|nr:TQO small subunit DoxD [Glycomyces buryatensis]THV32873.1 DoxX family membrane protein [Glycomyces buryatensis]